MPPLTTWHVFVNLRAVASVAVDARTTCFAIWSAKKLNVQPAIYWGLPRQIDDTTEYDKITREKKHESIFLSRVWSRSCAWVICKDETSFTVIVGGRNDRLQSISQWGVIFTRENDYTDMPLYMPT